MQKMRPEILRAHKYISINDWHTRIFFHPDFTVGTGVAPVRLPDRQFADCTASGDFHPALKISCSVLHMPV